MNKMKNSPRICKFDCIKEHVQEGVFVIPQKTKKCPKGFSDVQIMALSIIKSYNGILSYWQITELINQVYEQKFKETAVRGAMERLYKNDFLLREHVRKRAVQGNKYTLKSDPCTYIKKLFLVDSFVESDMESSVELETDSTMHSMQDIENQASNDINKESTVNSEIDQSDNAIFDRLMESRNENS